MLLAVIQYFGYIKHFVVERFPGSLSWWAPPDPISNSVVKTPSADDSVRSPHVKVGHCQDSYK